MLLEIMHDIPKQMTGLFQTALPGIFSVRLSPADSAKQPVPHISIIKTFYFSDSKNHHMLISLYKLVKKKAALRKKGFENIFPNACLIRWLCVSSLLSAAASLVFFISTCIHSRNFRNELTCWYIYSLTVCAKVIG